MKRRIFSFLIMFAMLMSLFAFSASAAGELTLTVSNEVATPGNTVDVTIELANNPGLAALMFYVNYDPSVLTLENVAFNNEQFGADESEAEDNGGVSAPRPYANPQQLTMVAALAANTANGVFATLTFRVASSATIGTVTDISLSFDELSALVPIDGNLSDCQVVPVNYVVGSVTVGTVVSGTISGVEAGTVSTASLYKEGESIPTYTTEVTGNDSYSFVVRPGAYRIEVAAAGYDTHSGDINATTENVTHDAALNKQVVTGITVECIGDIDYTVNGQTVTVDHEIACKVGYLSGDAYVAITATDNGNGTYSFTAPAGVTEVLLVVKGDINGDGDLTLADSTRTKAFYNKKITVTAKALFAANVNTDDSVTLADSTRIKAAYNKKTTLSW